MLQKVKQDFELNLPDFIKASNDFERIWLLTDAFVSLAEENGLELNRIIFMLELKNSCMFFELLSTFNDWLIQLTANCQSLGTYEQFLAQNGKILVSCFSGLSRLGIIRNQTLPQKLVPLQLTLAKGIFFEWVRTDGSFSLKETMRREIEVLLDVLPEYRR